MFCKKNAYTPKCLYSKGILQRIHTKTGSTAGRKSISKQDCLRPYFDYEFNDTHSSRIAQDIERCIKSTRKYQKETPFFVETILNRILYLHKYNLKVAEVTFKYPLTTNLTQLLLRFIVLECSVLYKRQYHTPSYEILVERRILRLLLNIYNAYFESLNSVPRKKLFKECCKAVLKLIIKIKSEFEVQNDLMESIAKKLLAKMGGLEQINALKEKCIPCPLDTYLSDPELVNTYKNIITSDYGTDDDLRTEEEIIQVDVENEENDNVNDDADIKHNIDDLLRVSNRLCQNPTTTSSTVKKVPTIYIGDDDEEMIVLEEEIRTSTKCAKRQKAEEEKKFMLREKQFQIISNHKPLKYEDVKPDMKEEVVDLNSEDEFSILENITHSKRVHNVNETNDFRELLIKDEVVVIDDDTDNTSTQLSTESPHKTCVNHFNDDILEVSSDEDESFNTITPEQDKVLCKSEDSSAENQLLNSKDNSKITPEGKYNKAIHEDKTTNHKNNCSNLRIMDIAPSSICDSALVGGKRPVQISCDATLLNELNENEQTSHLFPPEDTLISTACTTDKSKIETTFLLQSEVTNKSKKPLETICGTSEKSSHSYVLDTLGSSAKDSNSTRNFEDNVTFELTGNRENLDTMKNTVIATIQTMNQADKKDSPQSENIGINNIEIINGESTIDDTMKGTKFIIQECPSEKYSHKFVIDASTTDVVEQNYEKIIENQDRNYMLIEETVDSMQDKESSIDLNAELKKGEHLIEEKYSIQCNEKGNENIPLEVVRDTDFIAPEEVKHIVATHPSIQFIDKSGNNKNNRREQNYDTMIESGDRNYVSIEEPEEIIQEKERSIELDPELRKSEEYNIQCNSDKKEEADVPVEVVDDLALTFSKEVKHNIVTDPSVQDIDKNWNIRNSTENSDKQESLIDFEVKSHTKSFEENGDEQMVARNETENHFNPLNVDTIRTLSNTEHRQYKQLEENNAKPITNPKQIEDQFDQSQVITRAANYINAVNSKAIDTVETSEFEYITENVVEKEFKQKTSTNNENIIKNQEVNVNYSKKLSDFENSFVEEQDATKTIKCIPVVPEDKLTKNLLNEVSQIGIKITEHPDKINVKSNTTNMNYLKGDTEAVNNEGLENQNKDCYEIYNCIIHSQTDVAKNNLDKLLENTENTDSSIKISESNTKMKTASLKHAEENKINTECSECSEGNVVSDQLLEAPNTKPNSENIEYLIEQPTNCFIGEKSDEVEEVMCIKNYTEGTEKNLLVEEYCTSLDIQTTDENIETQELLHFENIVQNEIEVTTEGEHCEVFELEEQIKTNADTAMEETSANIEVTIIEAHGLKNALSDDLEVEHKSLDLPKGQLIEANEYPILSSEKISNESYHGVSDNLCNKKDLCDNSNAPQLISNLNIQKKDIVTETDKFSLEISQELIINDQLISKQAVKTLEICNIPNEKTSLDLLATVASEISKQDLLGIKKKRRQNKVKCVKQKHTSKKIWKGTLSSGDVRNKGVKKSQQRKNKNEINHEPKCKPHDFVIVNNSKDPPPSNNIYKHKLSDVELTSEDGNDSEGILLIDEDVDTKNSKSLKQVLDNPSEIKSAVIKKFTDYDENTLEENIAFPYAPKVKGTVLISIPETYQESFEFLSDIEELCKYSTSSDRKEKTIKTKNMHDIVYPMSSNIIATDFADPLLSTKYEKYQTETRALNSILNIGNVSVTPEQSVHLISEKTNCRPFRTKAEQKDYDKFSLKPYVSIERLNICLEQKEETFKHTRSKSFDIGMIRNLYNDQLTNKTSTNLFNRSGRNSESKIESGRLSSIESEDLNITISKTPSKLESSAITDNSQTPTIKLKCDVDDVTYSSKEKEESDDDIPLSQRTQLGFRQSKKLTNNSKSNKEKSDQRKQLYKDVKGKESNKGKKRLRKSEFNIEGKENDIHVLSRRSTRSFNKEKEASANTLDHISSSSTVNTSSLLSDSTTLSITFKHSVSSTNTTEKIEGGVCCPTGTVKTKDTNRENHEVECVPQNNPEIKCEEHTYDDIKNSNTKYYTTPKLRRKSISRQNLNRSEKCPAAKYEDTKQLCSSDKKYYTPPKLRRKSVVENEITPKNPIYTRKIVPKQIKLSTSKVFSKCKNTVSPTTEKLKRKLETDFKLNCTELSTKEKILDNAQFKIPEREGDNVNLSNLETCSATTVTECNSPNSFQNVLLSENKILSSISGVNKNVLNLSENKSVCVEVAEKELTSSTEMAEEGQLYTHQKDPLKNSDIVTNNKVNHLIGFESNVVTEQKIKSETNNLSDKKELKKPSYEDGEIIYMPCSTLSSYVIQHTQNQELGNSVEIDYANDATTKSITKNDSKTSFKIQNETQFHSLMNTNETEISISGIENTYNSNIGYNEHKWMQNNDNLNNLSVSEEIIIPSENEPFEPETDEIKSNQKDPKNLISNTELNIEIECKEKFGQATKPPNKSIERNILDSCNVKNLADEDKINTLRKSNSTQAEDTANTICNETDKISKQMYTEKDSGTKLDELKNSKESTEILSDKLKTKKQCNDDSNKNTIEENEERTTYLKSDSMRKNIRKLRDRKEKISIGTNEKLDQDHSIKVDEKDTPLVQSFSPLMENVSKVKATKDTFSSQSKCEIIEMESQDNHEIDSVMVESGCDPRREKEKMKKNKLISYKLSNSSKSVTFDNKPNTGVASGSCNSLNLSKKTNNLNGGNLTHKQKLLHKERESKNKEEKRELAEEIKPNSFIDSTIQVKLTDSREHGSTENNSKVVDGKVDEIKNTGFIQKNEHNVDSVSIFLNETNTDEQSVELNANEQVEDIKDVSLIHQQAGTTKEMAISEIDNTSRQQTDDYKVMIPLEKVSEVENSWMNRTENKKGSQCSSVKNKLEGGKLDDYNKVCTTREALDITRPGVNVEYENKNNEKFDQQTGTVNHEQIINHMSKEDNTKVNTSGTVEDKDGNHIQPFSQPKENIIDTDLSVRSNEGNTLNGCLQSKDQDEEVKHISDEQLKKMSDKDIPELTSKTSIEVDSVVHNVESKESDQKSSQQTEIINKQISRPATKISTGYHIPIDILKNVNTIDKTEELNEQVVPVNLKADFTRKNSTHGGIKKTCVKNITDIKIKNIEDAFKKYLPKSATGSDVAIKSTSMKNTNTLSDRKRKSFTSEEENSPDQKKSKFSQINVDILASDEVQSSNNQSLKSLSPLSLSRKKEKKSIECIISQLKEEKISSTELNESLNSHLNSTSLVNVDVGLLKEKLLQKIKGHGSVSPLNEELQNTENDTNIPLSGKNGDYEESNLKSEIVKGNSQKCLIKIAKELEVTKLENDNIPNSANAGDSEVSNLRSEVVEANSQKCLIKISKELEVTKLKSDNIIPTSSQAGNSEEFNLRSKLDEANSQKCLIKIGKGLEVTKLESDNIPNSGNMDDSGESNLRSEVVEANSKKCLIKIAKGLEVTKPEIDNIVPTSSQADDSEEFNLRSKVDEASQKCFIKIGKGLEVTKLESDNIVPTSSQACDSEEFNLRYKVDEANSKKCLIKIRKGLEVTKLESDNIVPTSSQAGDSEEFNLRSKVDEANSKKCLIKIGKGLEVRKLESDNIIPNGGNVGDSEVSNLRSEVVAANSKKCLIKIAKGLEVTKPESDNIVPTSSQAGDSEEFNLRSKVVEVNSRKCLIEIAKGLEVTKLESDNIISNSGNADDSVVSNLRSEVVEANSKKCLIKIAKGLEVTKPESDNIVPTSSQAGDSEEFNLRSKVVGVNSPKCLIKIAKGLEVTKLESDNIIPNSGKASDSEVTNLRSEVVEANNKKCLIKIARGLETTELESDNIIPTSNSNLIAKVVDVNSKKCLTKIAKGLEFTEVESDKITKENSPLENITLYDTTTFSQPATTEIKCNVVEKGPEITNMEIAQSIIKKSETSEIDNTNNDEDPLTQVKGTEPMPIGIGDGIDNSVVNDHTFGKCMISLYTHDVTSDCTMPVSSDPVRNISKNIEIPVDIPSGIEISKEQYNKHITVSSKDEEIIETGQINNNITNQCKVEKTIISSCYTELNKEISDPNHKSEHLNITESKRNDVKYIKYKDNLKTVNPSSVIEPGTISELPLMSDNISKPMPLIGETRSNEKSSNLTSTQYITKHVEEEDNMDSHNLAKKSFSHTCVEISSSGNIAESADSCVENVGEANLLNISSLMLHVDPIANVSHIPESVSSEAVRMISNIISTTISSTDSKLSCVSSTGTMKLFTFPATSQTNIKDQFISLNEVNMNKDISDECRITAEKLSSNENGSCMFPFNEQIDNTAPQILGSPSIELNLQEVSFTNIPIDNTQSCELISPSSMMPTSSGSNFMNEIPVNNGIITENDSSDTTDHNYTQLGGPLLSGRPEEKNIFSTIFINPLDDSPTKFPLNEKQLQELSQFSESDDTYKLKLDNEYAVNHLVMLGGQTSSDVNSFELSDLNLADLERMNLIEDSMSSEESSNSLDDTSLVNSVEQASRNITNDTNTWAQLIANENLNKKVLVVPNEQYLSPSFSVSQKDLIESFEDQIIETTSTTSSYQNKDTLLNKSHDSEIKNDLTVSSTIDAKEDNSLNKSAKIEIKSDSTKLNTSSAEDALLNKSHGTETKNKSTRSETSSAKKDALLNKSADSKRKIETTKLEKSTQKRSKIPELDTATQKNDFLPKRRYSRTVPRAPPKKKIAVSCTLTSETNKGKNTPQNKAQNESQEVNLELKPSNETLTNKKSLPCDDPPLLKKFQSSLSESSKNKIFNSFSKIQPTTNSLLPQYESQNNTSIRSHTSQILNPSKNVVDVTVDKQKQLDIHLPKIPDSHNKKQVHSENKNCLSECLPETSVGSTSNEALKSKETVNNLTKTADYLLNEKSDVQCNIADIVKSRKRVATIKYTAFNAKESKSDTLKSKQIGGSRGSRTTTPEIKPNPESLHQERKSHQQSQKSLSNNVLDKSAKFGVQKIPSEPGNKIFDTETKSNIAKNYLGNTLNRLPINTENQCNLQSTASTPEPAKTSSSKYNYSIDSILSKETMPNVSGSNKNLIKDKESRNRGVKRTLSTEEYDESQKKLIKIDYPEIRKSEGNSDATFDYLVKQRNVNKLIHLRVTEDNKLKIERRSSPLLKPTTRSEMEDELKTENRISPLVKSSSRSKEPNEIRKLKADQRSSPLVKSQHKNQDFGEIGKLRTDSPLDKLRSKNKHGDVKSSSHPVYSRPKHSTSGRRNNDREDRHNYNNRPHSPCIPVRNQKERDWHYSDYNRVKDGYYSEHIRGTEGHQSGYSRAKEGHYSDHSRVRTHPEHPGSSAARTSHISHSTTGRSSNVSEAYYKSSSSTLPQNKEQTTHEPSQSSGPFVKRNSKMSQEKLNTLLNEVRGIVFKQLRGDSSKEEEKYTWIDKINQQLPDTYLLPSNVPQHVPQTSSPPHKLK